MHVECRIIPDRAFFSLCKYSGAFYQQCNAGLPNIIGNFSMFGNRISTSTFLIKFSIIFSAAADEKWQAAANAKKSFLRKLLFLPFNAKAVSSVSVDTMFTGSMSYAGDNINSCEPGAVSSNENFSNAYRNFPPEKKKQCE